MLNSVQAHAKLTELLAAPCESECIEFKTAKDTFEIDKLGKYFSALSNEANLNSQDSAWLVLGVNNDRKICGSSWKSNRSSLDALKHAIAEKTTLNITFIEIYEVIAPERRAIMFEIPPAPRGIPIAWEGHYFGRNGESLVALNLDEIERIRRQVRHDWSAEIIEEATMNDLDVKAISKARNEYIVKHPHLAEELRQWDDVTFLNKVKVLKQGKITRAALILLGLPESATLTGHTHLTISWILQDGTGGPPLDYQHFSPPFILAVDQILGKIRNLIYRYFPNESLFPQEITTYDIYVIREALHNCIAHQDFALNGKVNLVEKPDELLFANVGSFLPGSVEAVIERDAPSEQYRNPFLAEAMVNLNMIDTIGSGIKRMFSVQRDRFFPLPEYDLSDTGRVEVKIFGKVLDQHYSSLLRERPDLDLSTVMLLDMVQKNKPITRAGATRLRTLHLIEGRFPHLFISSLVAIALDQRDDYIKKRPLHDSHYERLIISYLEKFGSASRTDLRGLLWEKLPDVLRDDQKEYKIHNILTSMKWRGLIHFIGARGNGKWHLNSHN